MNFQVVLDSFCGVLGLIYTTFGDTVFRQKEFYEIIVKIDDIIYK